MKEHERIKAQAMRTHEFVGEGQYCKHWSELSSRNTDDGRLAFRAQCGYPRDLHPGGGGSLNEYPKVYGPFKRHTAGPDKNKLIEGDWTRPELDYLQNLEWDWTEKVDGTNIRVHWDGHRVAFGGRTDRAQIPTSLLQVLADMFPEELFEQMFGEESATLYGEGYGARIQKAGGKYRQDQSFVLFDVQRGDWWLRRPSVEEVAQGLGVDAVPLVLTGTINDAIALVRKGFSSWWGPGVYPEGLVGVTKPGLLDRAGKRITVKIKAEDFHG